MAGKKSSKNSTHNEEKADIAEIFITTLKNKYVTSVSKNVYSDKLDDIVKKYNNIYHSTTKMKPVDAKSNTHIYSSKGINDEDVKFKTVDIVRISKYKNIFAKCYVPNWSEDVFVSTKVKFFFFVKICY